MKSLRSVAAFVNVVSAGSFSAAAAMLGVTPAAVSKSVLNLERELGIPMTAWDQHAPEVPVARSSSSGGRR